MTLLPRARAASLAGPVCAALCLAACGSTVARQILAGYPQYRRQYFGITRKGRRVLYVRGFCDKDPPADWRTTEVLVLDGGPCYFFARYDPVAKRFTFFEANGFA